MRITDLSTERNFLHNLMRSEERLGKLEDMASSGTRLTRPQDDPTGVERSLILRHHVAQTNQFARNVNRAKTWTEETEQALADLLTLIMRAQDLAIEGGTATTPEDARAYIAMEVGELLEEAQAIRNRTSQGRLLLTGTLPQWKVGPGMTVTVKDQSCLFDEVQRHLGDLYEGLKKEGDVALVGDAREGLVRVMDLTLAERAENGAKMNRLDMLDARLKTTDIEYRRLLSNVEDADLSELLVRLWSAQASYQAALGVGARLIQPSLLDYLR